MLISKHSFRTRPEVGPPNPAQHRGVRARDAIGLNVGGSKASVVLE